MTDVVKGIGKAPNRVKYTMNTFVISVGGYVKPLPEAGQGGGEAAWGGDGGCGRDGMHGASGYGVHREDDAAGKLGRRRRRFGVEGAAAPDDPIWQIWVDSKPAI